MGYGRGFLDEGGGHLMAKTTSEMVVAGSRLRPPLVAAEG